MEDEFGSSPKEKGRDRLSALHSPGQDPTESVGRQLEIVLVEDSPTDIFLVEEALAYHGIDARLTCHREGESMLRYIDAVDEGQVPCPDIVLLDLNLPRHNGRTLLARIRRSLVCGHVPVVIVTSSKDQDDRVAIEQLGASAYFHKSMDLEETMKLGEIVLRLTAGTSR